VKSVTDAGIAEYATIDAGGAVTVSASMDERTTPIGFAAGIGAVGVAAQVGVSTTSGHQNAHIDDNAAVVRSERRLTVRVKRPATFTRTQSPRLRRAGAIGAAVAYVSVDGDGFGRRSATWRRRKRARSAG